MGSPADLSGAALAPSDLVAARFRRLADLLEIEGANPFRLRAYRRAALTVERLGPQLLRLLARPDASAALDALPGIGDDLAGKILEVCETGRLRILDDTEARVPPGLVQLLALPGLGPKRVRALHAALGIRSVADLRAALATGAVGRLPRFGDRLAARWAAALASRERAPAGWPLATARPQAEQLRRALAGLPGVLAAAVAGSIRRGRPTVGDIDLVVAALPHTEVTRLFAALPEVAQVLACGDRQARVKLASGLQADLWVAAPGSFGATLIHATGGKAHNIALRRRAQALGLRLNEHGLHRGRRRIAGRTEAEVYAALGLPLIPPARREGRGEIEAAIVATTRRRLRLDAGQGVAARTPVS
jgi:DNA polymerase (family 10)